MPVPVKSQWDFLPPGQSIFDMANADSIPYFTLYLWAGWTIFWLAGLIMFLVRLKIGAGGHLLMRSPTLVLFSVIGGEAVLTFHVWDVCATHERYPCFAEIYYSMVFLPLYVFPLLLRIIRFAVVGSKLSSTPAGKVWTKESPYVGVLGILMSCCMGCAGALQGTMFNDWVTAYGCELNVAAACFVIAMLSVCIILAIVGVGLTWHVPDLFGFRPEIVACVIQWALAMVVYSVMYFEASREEGTISGILSLLVFAFVGAGFCSNVIWPLHLSMKRPPVFAGRALGTLEEVFDNAEAYAILRRIAVSSSRSESCDAALAIREFRSLRAEPTDELQSKAVGIFNKFVREGAPFCVNIDGALRRDVENGLQQVTSNLFTLLYQQLTQLIQNEPFRDLQMHDDYKALVARIESDRDTLASGI